MYEYELLKAAARAHEVVVMSTSVRPSQPVPALAELGVETKGVAWSGPRPLGGRGAVLVRQVTGSTPGVVWRMEPAAAALGRAVAAHEARHPVDVVSVWPGEMAAVAATTVAPSALILADCYTRQAERELREARTWRQRQFWRLEARNARRWEATAYARASALGCVSPLDGQLLSALTGSQVDAVPLALGDAWFEAPHGVRGADVVFVGALDYRPNVEGLRWFAAEIWPRVTMALPSANLHIVGRNPVAAVTDAARQCGAQLHADVPDVRPWYWRAGVVVSPVRLGSGTRNKILHAFACRAPLVATSASIEGLECVAGEHLLVADDAESFARAITDSLTDTTSAGERACRAGHLAHAYSGERAGEALHRLWERAASRDG